MKILILNGCVFAGRDASAGEVITVPGGKEAAARFLIGLGFARDVTDEKKPAGKGKKK